MKQKLTFFKSQLYKQYFKTILLYFSIPCILFCLFIAYSYMNHYRYVLSVSSENAFIYTEQYLNSVFSESKNKFSLIVSDKNVKNCMFLNEDKFYLYKNQQFTDAVNTLLNYSINTSDTFSSVYLYSIKNNYIYCVDKTYNVSSGSKDTFCDMTWYERYAQKPSNRMITGLYNDIYGCNVISLIYEIKYNNDIAGLIVFNTMENTFCEFLNNNDENNYVTDILITYDDEPVFSSSGFDNRYQFKQKQFNKAYYEQALDFYNNVRLYESVTFPKISELLPLGILAASVFLFVILLPVFIALFLSEHFYKTIAKITTYIQEIDSTNVNIENEIDFIYARLKNALHLSRNFEYEIAKNITDTQQSQLISLQMQLNPHFLFNTLNTLTLMNSTDAKKENFERLMRNLSNLLSYSLNTTNTLVSFENELEYLKYYIEIEELKYDAKLNIHFDIYPEALTNSLPKFTFQPVVENSLKHGFKYNLSENNKIYINARVKNGKLLICITDNGNGMSADTVNKLNDSAQKSEFPQNKNIGLLNINKRINLLFGNEYGCRVYSRIGTATTVKIVLPGSNN